MLFKVKGMTEKLCPRDLPYLLTQTKGGGVAYLSEAEARQLQDCKIRLKHLWLPAMSFSPPERPQLQNKGIRLLDGTGESPASAVE